MVSGASGGSGIPDPVVGIGVLHRIAIVALVWILLLPFLFSEPFRLVEARLYDILSTLSPLRPTEAGVVIVAIDEPSFAEVGQRWPWPRSLHADLVRRLREAGAKVIGLDIVFADPSEPAADRALADALGADTILAADDVSIALEQGTQTTRVGPTEALEGRAAVGITSVDLDADGYQRRLPVAPDSFALVALRLAGIPVQPPPDGALVQSFGPPRSYPTISYYQALDSSRHLPPDRLRGRIVFVGLNLRTPPDAKSGAADAFLTPFTVRSGALTAGVEVQATLLDNLRHRLFVVPVSRTVVAGLTLACAALGGILAGPRTSWRTGLVGIATIIGTVAAAWLLLRYARIWVPPALPAGAFAGVLGAHVFLDVTRERQLRRQVSDAFSRYLSPDLVSELARNPAALKLGGERRTLTILFCDIRGFTALSEQLREEPERLTALVNRLLDPLSAAVLAEGGTIDKYIGDCIMAFWNAPLPSPDHALRAVRAGLRMLDAVDRVNEDLRREEGRGAPRFAVGIGINTGDCIVGNIGSRWRYDYSVLGDAVNLAARLEGLSKQYDVALVLGPATAEAVGGHVDVVELDRISVRGRLEQTTIYTVVRRGGSPVGSIDPSG